MNPAQTLHDFTLNLLNDSAARSAFGADPERALSDAGLGDVTAADVHEVVPLVLDFAPVSSLGDQAFALDSIDSQLGAIDQLKALTQNLGVSDQITETNLLNSVSGVTAITQDVTGAFSSANDLSHSLDSSIGDTANPVTAVTGAVGDVTGGDLTSGITNGLTSDLTGGDVTGALDGGDLTSGLTSGLSSSLTDGADLTNGIGDLGSTVGDITSPLHAVTDLGGVTGHLGDIAGNGTVDDLTSHVGDISGNNGDIAGNLHDVVGNVGNGIGGGTSIGDIDHIDVGGVLSGNDVHFTQ
jgi:hypothetical protein